MTRRDHDPLRWRTPRKFYSPVTSIWSLNHDPSSHDPLWRTHSRLPRRHSCRRQGADSMKRLRRAALFLLIALVLGAALWISLQLPYRNFAAETFVKFDRGSGTVSMARALEQEGVIRYAWLFWIERALHPSAKLARRQQGYKFQDAASVSAVFGRIAHGDVYYFEFTVPEGSNIFDIARLVEAAGTMPAQVFLTEAENPMSIRDLDPKAQTLEGYLFPATYRLSHSTTAAELCQLMTAQFRRQWKKLLAAQSPGRSAAQGTGQTSAPLADPHRTVTLASMVEKETAALAEERPLHRRAYSSTVSSWG